MTERGRLLSACPPASVMAIAGAIEPFTERTDSLEAMESPALAAALSLFKAPEAARMLGEMNFEAIAVRRWLEAGSCVRGAWAASVKKQQTRSLGALDSELASSRLASAGRIRDAKVR